MPGMGIVVAYLPNEPFDPGSHESVTRLRIAEKIAGLLGYAFAGERHAGDCSGRDDRYFIPSQTIVGVEAARALGIRSSRDLFGGVVPHAFVASKTITHPLYDGQACAPVGWSAAFPREVAGVVLRGYSAFDADDARRAGCALLDQTGSVRVKAATGVGGRDQAVAEDERELDAAIAALDEGDLRECGVALEENLTAVTTYSIGRVQIGDHLATYCGTQKLTRDHAGNEVYGGSALTCARGGFDALMALPLPADARRAAAQAQVYDAAADRCFDGFIASRRNYDSVTGRNTEGTAVGGVLEQSWRIGGASGAEIAALEYFAENPEARAVRVECTEAYDAPPVPAGAIVYFDGVDRKVGRILKYTTVTPYVDA